MLTPLAHHRLLLLALCFCTAMAGVARADDDRQSEFVPELDAYWNFSERFRLFVAASTTQSLSEGVTDGDVGAYLDILSIKPIFPDQLLDLDWARNRYVWARVGYAVGGIHEGLALRNGFSETRFVAEVSGRYPISHSFFATTRARLDLRTLSGERSNRYRFRLGVEGEYTVLGREVVPYAHAEVLYDTRFDAWSRQIYQVGVDIELTQSLHLEPSYAFQVDTSTEPRHVDRVGLSLKYYR